VKLRAKGIPRDWTVDCGDTLTEEFPMFDEPLDIDRYDAPFNEASVPEVNNVTSISWIKDEKGLVTEAASK
jgi:hypothetical protein